MRETLILGHRCILQSGRINEQLLLKRWLGMRRKFRRRIAVKERTIMKAKIIERRASLIVDIMDKRRAVALQSLFLSKRQRGRLQ